MAHVIADRVRETTSTTGLGAFTLTGAVSGFRTIAAALTVNADTAHYCAVQGAEWEVGLGTRVSATSLGRTTLLASSSGGFVSFTAAPEVFITLPAAQIATLSGNTFTGGQILSDQLLTRAMLKDSGHAYFDSTTTNALDYVNGSHQRWAPAVGAQTLSIANWPPTGNQGILLIEGVNLGASTITWPVAINWIRPDGTTTTAVATYLAANSGRTAFKTAGTDFLLSWTRDAGTTIYAKLV